MIDATIIHRVMNTLPPGYTGSAALYRSHVDKFSANMTKRGAAATDTLASDRPLNTAGDAAVPTIPTRQDSEQEKPFEKSASHALRPIGEIACKIVLSIAKKTEAKGGA